MKKLLIIVLLLTLTACKKDTDNSASCEENEVKLLNGECILEDDTNYDNLPYSPYLSEDNPVVTIEVKDIGNIQLELFPDVAPNTVNNFIQYIEDGAYENNKFHRVMDGFMIQGGLLSEPACEIKGEMTNNNINNPLKHTTGVLSMARIGGQYDSQTSQFFIMDATSDFLDDEYASFGGVVSGMHIVHYIADLQETGTETPSQEVIINNITVEYSGRTFNDRVCLIDYENPVPTVNFEKDNIDPETLPYKDYLNANNPLVTIEVEGVGTMEIQLFPDVAPNTVNNIIDLIEEGRFDGLDFHQVSKNFFVKTGKLDPASCAIAGEFTNNGFANPLEASRGVLLLENEVGEFDSQSSIVVILQNPLPSLNGKVTTFGGLISGFNVLDFLANSEVNNSDESNYTLRISSITVERNGYTSDAVVCVE